MNYDLNYYIVLKSSLEIKLTELEYEALEKETILLDCKKLIVGLKRLPEYGSPEVMKIRLQMKKLEREIAAMYEELKDKELDLEHCNFMIKRLTNK